MEKINKEKILEGFKNGRILLSGDEFYLHSRDGWWIDIDAVNDFIKNEKDNEFLFECMKGEIEALFKRLKAINNNTVRDYMEMFGDDMEILLKAQDFTFNIFYLVYEQECNRYMDKEMLLLNFFGNVNNRYSFVDDNSDYNVKSTIQLYKNLNEVNLADAFAERRANRSSLLSDDEVVMVAEELLKEKKYYNVCAKLVNSLESMAKNYDIHDIVSNPFRVKYRKRNRVYIFKKLLEMGYDDFVEYYLKIQGVFDMYPKLEEALQNKIGDKKHKLLIDNIENIINDYVSDNHNQGLGL